MALLLNTQPTDRQYDHGKWVCSLCNELSKPDALHVVFFCNALEDIRRQVINSIQRCMPIGMKIDFSNMLPTVSIVWI